MRISLIQIEFYLTHFDIINFLYFLNLKHSKVLTRHESLFNRLQIMILFIEEKFQVLKNSINIECIVFGIKRKMIEFLKIHFSIVQITY